MRQKSTGTCSSSNLKTFTLNVTFKNRGANRIYQIATGAALTICLLLRACRSSYSTRYLTSYLLFYGLEGLDYFYYVCRGGFAVGYASSDYVVAFVLCYRYPGAACG